MYFSGIGGVSMASLAELSLMKGHRVFGSDTVSSDRTEDLKHKGAVVFYTQDEKNLSLSRPDAVIYSLAIPKDSPELSYAARMNIPMLSRAEYMSALLKEYSFGIAVAGSHGKSTVTAMLASAFFSSSMRAGVISGADTGLGGALVMGGEDYIIYEACEYKNAFLNFTPDVAVALNLELDHVDFFRTEQELMNSFLLYLNSAARFALINADDLRLMSLRDRLRVPCITVGRSDSADYKFERVATVLGYNLRLYRDARQVFDIPLSVFGEHNAFNAALSLALCHAMGIKSTAYLKALSSFSGIERRMEYIGKYKSSSIYYDYAHHPSEIRATLSALRESRRGSLAIVFCPHTYSRTKAFLDDFARALSAAELVVITDIFAAREANDPDVSSELLAAKTSEYGTDARYIRQDEILDSVDLSKYDNILLMGAGNLDCIKMQLSI